MKVHWVNGVGEREVENKTDQTTATQEKKQPNHIKEDVEEKKSRRRATQESVDNRQDGEEGNYHGD